MYENTKHNNTREGEIKFISPSRVFKYKEIYFISCLLYVNRNLMLSTSTNANDGAEI